jgi:hypothetical protein
MRLTARPSTSPTSLVFRLAERLPGELGALLVVGEPLFAPLTPSFAARSA